MFTYEQLYVVSKHNKDLDKTFQKLNEDPDTQLRLECEFNHGKTTLVTSYAYNATGYDNNCDLIYYDSYILTPTCMEIVYHLLSGKLKVLTDETISNSAHSGLKLSDPNTFKTMDAMLGSDDRKSAKMGVDLLIHADLSGDIIWNVYRLAQEHGSLVEYYDRSKGLTYFLEQTNWHKLSYMDEQEFLTYAEKQGQLTREIVAEIIPNIYEINFDQCQSFNSTYFEVEKNEDNISWTITLTPEWKSKLKPEYYENK